MAENGVSEPTIGILLDGTGYGADGTIWGGEVLIGDFRRFRRHAWLAPVAMPGGTAAIRQPWRMALSYLTAARGEEWNPPVLPAMATLGSSDVGLVLRMLERRINAPMTSSCGRLFDAVSAMLGIRSEVSYEAQAAIELEAAIDPGETGWYEKAVEASGGDGALAVIPLIRAIVEEILRGEPAGRIAARFHATLAAIWARAAESARRASGINRVGLSGGVFQNVHLLRGLASRLRRLDFEVLTHSRVPPNDGGLALGQVMVADATLADDGDRIAPPPG
jgi:hydrogenase maturation protein HypF